MTLPDDVITWAGERCGGRVVDIEQQIRWRPHHFLTIDRPGGRTRVLARSKRTDTQGAGFMEHFDIAHEARVLEALQGRGLKVPEFFGFNEHHGVILMECVAGSNDLLTAPDDATRKQVMAEYIEQLAKLHQLEVEPMHLSGLTIPRTPDDIAFGGKFGFIEADFARWRRHLRPEPFLELGIWWLHANVPAGARAVTFCQADTGPGQFMFADGHVTALIDWELAHIGDPCQDLALSQGMLKLWDRERILEHYERTSGIAIPRDNLAFYVVWNAFKSMLALNNGLRSFLSGDYPRLARATLGFGKVKLYEHLLGGILDLDLDGAAEFIARGQPNPYHDRKVTGG